MARLTREGWVKKGLDVLEEKGYQAIKLENLCATFHLTKGSFYHHFESMDEYIKELVKTWEATLTGRFREIMSSTHEPQEQLRLLIGFVFKVSGKTEMAFRMWATQDEVIKAYMNKLDNERMRIPAEIYMGLGLPKKEADELGHFAHMTWLGLQTMHIFEPAGKDVSITLLLDMFTNIRATLLQVKKD